jgi:peptide/nickel transport system substrate-binding protein
MSRLRFSRHRRNFLKFFGLFSLCIALVVGCARPQTSDTATTGAATPASNGRVSMGTTLKARTLDPADAYEIFPLILLQNMGDRLYTYKPGTTELVPQLATELPKISPDGLTYTIPLRQGVKFHDGTAFDAKAMEFSIKRFIENAGRPTYLLSEKIDSVQATGPNELTIKLKTPFAAFTSLLTFSGVTPVSPGAYELGAGKFKPDSFIGTGPYKLASFSTDTIKLDPNPDYWGEKPANEGIDIQLITSPANLYNTFRTGGLDVAYQTLDPDQIASLEREAGSGGWQVITAGTNVINYMTLNQKIKPFDDLRVRQAVASMIDRNLLNQRVFQGQAEPLYSMIPLSFKDVYQPVFQEAFGDANYEKAKQLLTEAGFSTAKPFTLEVWYPSASTTRSLVANTMKEAIEKNMAGLVKVDVQNVEGATLFEKMSEGIYPSVLQNWYPDFYDVDNFVQPFMSCDKVSAQKLCEEGSTKEDGTFYYSDRANQLVKQQRANQDATARKAEVKELQTLMAKDTPFIPLWQNKDYVFAQGNLQNVAIQPTQQFLLWQISKK